MMQRRSFLGAMLASFTAPYAMSGAIERGILMPVQPKLWTPAAEGEIILPSKFAGPMIRLFTAAGILLAEIPLSDRQKALFEYGRKVGMDLTGSASALASGHADRFELDLSENKRLRGKVGDELRLSNKALVVGDDISIPALRLLGDV